ncbi:MAG: helix-turn-helix domain-containing protein [bacterium]|nr:helix-turn-helix domain-containing protein [bacterium]
MRIGRRFVIGVVVIIFFLIPLWGLDPSLDLDDYLIDHWGVDAGLPADNVRCLAQTPDGYLWVGTYGGLVRFDGVRFQAMDSGDKARTLDSTTRSLHVDRRGALWISTFSGLTRYKDNRFRYFGEADGLPRDTGFRVFEDVNEKILVTAWADAVYYFERDTEKFLPLPSAEIFKGNFISTILLDSKGILWFGANEEGLFKLVNDRFEKIKFNLPVRIRMHRDMIESRDGAIWVGTGKGLIRMDGEEQELYNSSNIGLSHDRTKDLLEDKDGVLWITTWSGINRMTVDKTGKRQVQVALKKEFTDILLEDSEHNVWVGTRGFGLKRFRNPTVKTYTTEDGLSNNFIRALMKDGKGVIWIATNTGLCRYENGTFKAVPTKTNSDWFGLCEDKEGNIWATCLKGLVKNPAKEALLFTKKHGDLILNLYCDSKNRLWGGSTRGAVRYADGVYTHFTKAQGFPGDVCNGFYEDKNHDILATGAEGMIRLRNGEFPTANFETEMPGLTPSFIFEDKHNPDVLWAGTYIDGLQRFADGKWFSFKDAPGMLTNQFYMAVEDEYGYFWFAGNRGIIRINKKGLEQFAEGKNNWINCTTFNLKDGMLSLECSLSCTNSIIKTNWGEYWFATKKGISVLDPSEIKIDTRPPNVILESVTVNRKEVEVKKEVLQLKDVKELAFQFTAPSFTSPGNMRFRYRLTGVDETWQTLPPGARRYVSYFDLPTGNIRFQVSACNKDSVWNREGVTVDFTIIPPFYASLWFWLIILFCLTGIAVTVFLWFRKNYIRKVAPATPYEGTKLDTAKSKKVMKGLRKVMGVEKIYREEDLSLGSLAGELNVSVHFLSQLINERLGENFYDMVNRYRVEEVKARLCDPDNADLSILEISYDAGFSAKSSFNRYFKKMTDMTPSAYRKKNQRKRYRG